MYQLHDSPGWTSILLGLQMLSVCFRMFKSIDIDLLFLVCVLKSSVFLSGRKIMMNTLGPKIHKRTTNPLIFKANEITAVRDLYSVAK